MRGVQKNHLGVGRNHGVDNIEGRDGGGWRKNNLFLSGQTKLISGTRPDHLATKLVLLGR